MIDTFAKQIQVRPEALQEAPPRGQWLHARLGSPGHAVSRRQPDESAIHRYFPIQLTPPAALALVRRFRYAAAICAPNGQSPVTEEAAGPLGRELRRLAAALWYAGDIPDWAVERIILAKALGLDYITIHSNQPLPVRVMGNAYTDPVVLGWTHNPYLTHRYHRSAWETDPRNPMASAHLIAIWDEEGEPSNDPLPLE